MYQCRNFLGRDEKEQKGADVMNNRLESLTLAIAGNPNCGKTTLFNALTGSEQRVGNWPGVTVEKIEGVLKAGKLHGVLIDLPGIYTLVPDSEDEVVARKFLAVESYDLVINMVDAANLERNLYLTTQLVEMGIPLVLVLNKIDLAAKNGITIDTAGLSKKLGVPIYAVNSTDPRDVKKLVGELEQLLISGVHAAAPAMVRYPDPIENYIRTAGLDADLSAGETFISRRSVLLSFIEQDPVVTKIIQEYHPAVYEKLTKAALNVRKELADDPDIVLAEARYGVIQQLQNFIIHENTGGRAGNRNGNGNRNRKKIELDDIVLHRIWGIPIFIFVMYLVFMVTLSVGGAFIDFFDIIFGAVFVDGFGMLLEGVGSPSWLTTFLAGGLGGGIQTISTFVPIIFFMFLMLSILEDSGYMARAAFVMDRFMRFVGLPGKAFVPMLVGFGCTVPAILATRTLENKRDRFLTIFMVPFMSCGARLPVYALFAVTFFNQYAGLIVFSIYIAGILLAVMTGLILKRTLFKGEFSPFIMELPDYHLPKFSKVMRNTLFRLRLFVFRAGKVILLAVFILTILNSWGVDGTFGNEDSENSVLSVIGKAITPVFNPMGIRQDNWEATVGLFTGIFAKEAVIGTLNSLYGLNEEDPIESDEAVPALRFFWEALAEAFITLGQNLVGIVGGLTDPLGFSMVSGSEEAVSEALETGTGTFSVLRSKFSAASAYAYLLFILIYFPCVAALGAAFREAGKFYGTVLVTYVTLLAWVVSVLFYQFAEGRSIFWIAAALGVYGLIYLSLYAMGKAGRKGKGKLDAKAFL
jgi:ferrous iron transport protein B